MVQFKHRQALDLIFENKPDMSNLLFSALFKKLENEDIYTGNIELDKNVSSNKYIKFNTPYSRKLFPKLIDPRKSGWGTDYMFCYQIYNIKSAPLRVFATMLITNSLENERKIFEDVCAIIDKRPLKKDWNWKQISLSKNNQIINFDEISPEEFNEEKENIINSMFINIINVVKAFEDKLQKEGL